MTLTEKVDRLPWYKKIEVLRAIAGLKQVEVAEKCNVDQRIYWNWENGMSIPVERNRKAIAKVFDVSEDDIFTGLYKK